MKKYLSKLILPVALVLVLFVFTGPEAVVHCSASIPGLIRIGLAVDQNELFLQLTGSEKFLELSENRSQTLNIPGDQVWFTCKDNVIFINDNPVGGPVLILPEDGFLSWISRCYRGAFLVSGQKGKLNLINVLSLDEYLCGVLPKEISPGWPMAAVKAQAIAARSYTIASLSRHGANNFDLCPIDHCQVYGGVSGEHPNTNQAIADTVNQVLTYRGKVVAAYYHAASGGLTEEAETVWGNPLPYTRPVADWDQNSPHVQWTRSIKWSELQALMSQSYPQIGRLRQILPVTFGRDGKTLKINLVGDSGEISITSERFRYLTGIPSTKFQMGLIYGPEPYITLWWAHNSVYPEVLVANNEIPGLAADVINPPWDSPDPWEWLRDKEPERLVVRGSGWGHGIGLSQWGAKGMADAGFNERQILAHYYPGAVISSYENLR